MKKFLSLIVLATLCLSLFSVPAFADGNYADPANLLAPPADLSTITDYNKLTESVNTYYAFFGSGWHQNHGEFANPNCSDDHHENDCIHQRLWNLIIGDNQSYTLQQLNAMLVSGDWARRGILRLADILPQTQYWTLEKYAIHEKTANGWTELWLKNYQTNESLYCVMNAYTTKSLDSDDGTRQFVFTWSHQNNVKLKDYDSSQLITSLSQSKDVATAEFVSMLIRRNGGYNTYNGYNGYYGNVTPGTIPD
ncbi:MAG: hypothetical protein Q4E46_03540 [Candidatus Saccharibacteria bacterium]|nr:hypothetical protein [Candidatus Saccharibacteria bacterium]